MSLRWLDVIRLRLRSLFRRTNADADLDRELRAHLEQQVDEYVARGMTRDEATGLAVSTFGGVERVRESRVSGSRSSAPRPGWP